MPLSNDDMDHFSNARNKFNESIYTMSFPRSGSAWCRYMLECITRYKSFGYAGWEKVSGSPRGVDSFPRSSEPEEGWDETGVIRKRHWWEEHDIGGATESKISVILLLRNPEDLAARGALDSDRNYWTYVDLLEKWIEHDGPKVLVPYDCLVQKPIETLKFFSKFLELGEEGARRIERFSEALPQHVVNSRAGAQESRHAEVDSSIKYGNWDKSQTDKVYEGIRGIQKTGEVMNLINSHFSEPGGRHKVRLVRTEGGVGSAMSIDLVT